MKRAREGRTSVTRARGDVHGLAFVGSGYLIQGIFCTFDEFFFCFICGCTCDLAN